MSINNLCSIRIRESQNVIPISFHSLTPKNHESCVQMSARRLKMKSKHTFHARPTVLQFTNYCIDHNGTATLLANKYNFINMQWHRQIRKRNLFKRVGTYKINENHKNHEGLLAEAAKLLLHKECC